MQSAAVKMAICPVICGKDELLEVNSVFFCSQDYTDEFMHNKLPSIITVYLYIVEVAETATRSEL